MVDKVRELKRQAIILRRDIVEMVGVGHRAHYGGSLSCIDIITVLYFYKMRHDPGDPLMKERDRFLLSKGHSVLAQYVALAESGYFPKEELKNLKNLGSMLQGHPDMKRTPGIEANTGSLGQGLSIANGMALGLKKDNIRSKVYVIMGDGELAEGQVWEAAMFASHYKLDNIIVIIDKNNIQATGFIKDRLNINPLKDKWNSFGWHTMEIDGHNITEIINALNECDKICDKPKAIIANTVKGKGIKAIENTAAYHNNEFTQELYEKAIKELDIMEQEG